MTNKLKKEIEELRALLQTYLASDMDIDEMDFNEVVNYAVEEIQDGSNIFLGHWKDYAFLRGKLSQKQEFEEMINKRINKLKILIKDYKEPEVNEFYARINELKELKNQGKSILETPNKKQNYPDNLQKEIEDETIGSHGDKQFDEWFERLVDGPKDLDKEFTEEEIFNKNK